MALLVLVSVRDDLETDRRPTTVSTTRTQLEQVQCNSRNLGRFLLIRQQGEWNKREYRRKPIPQL